LVDTRFVVRGPCLPPVGKVSALSSVESNTEISLDFLISPAKRRRSPTAVPVHDRSTNGVGVRDTLGSAYRLPLGYAGVHIAGQVPGFIEDQTMINLPGKPVITIVGIAGCSRILNGDCELFVKVAFRSFLFLEPPSYSLVTLSFGYLFLAAKLWFHRLPLWDTPSNALRLLP
jgi:hypothetical protein